MIRNVIGTVFCVGLPLVAAIAFTGNAHAQTTCGTSAPRLTCTKRPHPRLNIDTFANTIADDVKALNLKGFSISVYGEDGHPNPILTLQQGLGSGPTETTFNFTPQVASLVGSVSKLIVQSAVRHAIEINNDAKVTTAACTVNTTTPFLNVLPSAFGRAAGASSVYHRATIEHLLQHRAGVPNGTLGTAEGYPDFLTIMTRPGGDSVCAFDSGCYANENYVLAGLILPLIRDCTLRATIDGAAATFCRRNATGPDKDRCEMQNAYDQLALLSNTIVKDMTMDPVNAKASCLYTDLTNAGVNVARGFASATQGSGLYLPPEPRGCAAAGWYTSSSDLGRIVRRMWDGSFFNHRSTSAAMPDWHGGDMYWTWNGVSGEWHAAAINILSTDFGSERISAAFLANSPVSPGTVADIIAGAFGLAEASAPSPVNQGIFTSLRGTWKCSHINSASHTINLRIANRYDTKVFGPHDFGGEGSETQLTPTSVGTNSASGTFVFYRAGTSPKANFGVSRGTFTLAKNASTGVVSYTQTINGASPTQFTNCMLLAD